MLTSLGKIRVTNKFVPNAVYIAGKYYSLSSALDGTDKTELVAELRKIQVTSLEAFSISRATLFAQLGDEASAYRMMAFMQMLMINSPTYSLSVKDRQGLWYVDVTGSLTDIINAYEGTSAAAGTPNIAVDPVAFVDTVPPTISTATVENAQPTRIVLTYNEALLASPLPAVGDFAVSGGKTVSSVGISGSAITITVNSGYANGNIIKVSYTPGTNKIKDAAGNLAAAFTLLAVTNNVA